MKLFVKYFDRILLFISVFLLIFLCFYRLDADQVLGFDEGRHGINALEMLQNKSWVISTYNGEVDYFNLKPPLSMYQIILGYLIFGVNKLGLRFFSAICYILTALFAAWFVRKRSDNLTAAFCIFLFSSSKVLILESYARKGDANAIYNLFFLISMLSLFKLTEHTKDIVSNHLFCCMGIGFGFSMAFLSKSYHAMLIPIIVFFTFLWKPFFLKLKGKDWIALITTSTFPILFWAYLRYQKDGITFFKKMLVIDVFQRTKERIAGPQSTPTYYIDFLIHDFSTVSILFLLGFYILLVFYNNEKFKCNYKELILLIIIPVLLYSIPKTRMITYIYPSIIGLFILGSFAFYFLRKQKVPGITRYIRILAYGIILFILTLNIRTIFRTEQFENPGNFEYLIEESKHLLTGSGNIYTTSENPYFNDWYQDQLFYIEKDTALHCMTGGANAFRKDKEGSYLIIDHSDHENLEFTISKDEKYIYKSELYSIVKKENVN